MENPEVCAISESVSKLLCFSPDKRRSDQWLTRSESSSDNSSGTTKTDASTLSIGSDSSSDQNSRVGDPKKRVAALFLIGSDSPSDKNSSGEEAWKLGRAPSPGGTDSSSGGEEARKMNEDGSSDVEDEGDEDDEEGDDDDDDDEGEEEEVHSCGNGWPGWDKWPGFISCENIPHSWNSDDEKDVDETDPNWRDIVRKRIRERYVREFPQTLAAMQDLDYGVFPGGGTRPRNHELWNRYYKQLEESDCYDMKDFPGITMLTPVVPVLGFFGYTLTPSMQDMLVELATIGIQEFNNKNAIPDDEQYEFHELLTANARTSGTYVNYYVTFQAKKKKRDATDAAEQADVDVALTTFQAKGSMNYSTSELQLHECRIKIFKYLPSFHLSPDPAVPPGHHVCEECVVEAERRKYDLNA